tara:strand:+ start:24448 stop:24969 length:522 start_codon:yes stop_codon:yes gene_type:complete
MKIENTNLKEVKLIIPDVHNDERGHFLESFNEKLSKQLKFKAIQFNESKSGYGVLRGIHFQKNPYEQSKLIRVIKGEIQDVAIDLRPDSKTYKEYVSVKLNDENKNLLFIPKGFGHGFLTLSKNAIVSYAVDEKYNADYDSGVRFNDEVLNISWLLDSEKIILSKKDENLPFI